MFEIIGSIPEIVLFSNEGFLLGINCLIFSVGDNTNRELKGRKFQGVITKLGELIR